MYINKYTNNKKHYRDLLLYGGVGEEVDEQKLEAGQVEEKEKFTYTINFMWINRSKDPTQLYLFPTNGKNSEEEQKKELFDKYLNNIIEWGKKHDRIIIWYDGTTTTHESADNTELAIIDLPNISFRNCTGITSFIETKKTYIHVISKELVNRSIYFKTDLYRIMVGLYDILNKPDNYYHVFANLNMPPLSKEDLFDKKTLDDLSFYGTVLSCNLSEYDCGWLGFENSFFIMANISRTEIVKSYTFFVDVLIMLFRNGIKHLKNTKNPRQAFLMFDQKLDQMVYDLYPILFLHNYIKRGFIKYMDDKKIITDVLDMKNIMGIIHSQYPKYSDIIKLDLGDIEILNGFDEKIKSNFGYSLNKPWFKIPTKPILQPVARRQYSMMEFIGNTPKSYQ